MSDRDDAFNIFNDINNFESTVEAPKKDLNISNQPNSAESTTGEISKDSDLEGISVDGKIRDIENHQSPHEALKKTEDADISSEKRLTKEKTLVDKLAPTFFVVIIIAGVLIFILAAFFPGFFDSSDQQAPVSTLQDAQVMQANATNKLIDNLKEDKDHIKENLETAIKKNLALSTQLEQQKALIRQQEAQLSSVLLANQQSQQIIAALKVQLAKSNATSENPNIAKGVQKFSSTKKYHGVEISSMYQGQAWIREGNKTSVLTEGDSYRGSVVTNIDPLTRTVQTTKGIIK